MFFVNALQPTEVREIFHPLVKKARGAALRRAEKKERERAHHDTVNDKFPAPPLCLSILL